MKNKPIRYVVGFLLDPTLAWVVLVRKNKPPQQEGLLNGIGGKVESKERPEQAMQREFLEEANCNIANWKYFAKFIWQSKHHPHGAEIFFYVTTGNIHLATPRTAEKIEIHRVDDVMNRSDVVPILRWTLQMARGVYFGEEFTFEVEGVSNRSA